MSLYYVNDHLITEEVISEGTWPQNDNECYKRVMIKTTAEAMKRLDDGTFEPLSRVICAHNCSTMPQANTRISSTIKDGAFAPKITVRTSSDTRYNSDIFVVALPYDGMIKPIVHDENSLQIFKSVILKSDKFSIKHEDANYKRVAYFVVRPHHGHLGNDGWYDDSCNLVVTFAQSNRSRDNQSPEEMSWTFKTVTVRFGEAGKYEITSESETAPYDSFNPDDIKSAKICALVEPTKLTGDASEFQPRSNNRGYDRDDRGNGGGKKNWNNGKKGNRR